MKLAENIDYTKPVEFRAWHDNKSDSTAFFVGQKVENTDEKSLSVPQKYTRDNPNGLPPPKEKYDGGWSYDDQMAFLHQRMMEVVIPMVHAAQPVDEPQDEPEHGEDDPETLTPLDPKLMERVKASLADLAEHPQYQDRSRKQLLEEFFGTSQMSEIETMPAETVKAVVRKIDGICVPF